jgi:quinol monooxygenase YgiN/uncharacterized protein YunC (DUF1805 family)
MKNIIATLRARPGKGPALENELRSLVRATAKEPGAMVYDLLRDEAQADTVIVYERYRDAAAKADHLAGEALKNTLEKASALLAEPPVLQHLSTSECIRHSQIERDGQTFELVELPIGPVSLVYARTAKGLLACGAIDPMALEKFGVAAARVRPTRGNSIGSLEDLLEGEVREANALAQALGIKAGMGGREALKRL